MKAGALSCPIVVEARATTVDAFGEQSSTWTAWASMYARIETLGGRELQTAQAFRSDVSHRITARYLDGVTAAHRVRFGSRVFDIAAVFNVDERGREMQILASEGLAAG